MNKVIEKSFSDSHLWANKRVSFTDFRNASVVIVALIVFDNDQVEKLSLFLLRRHVDVLCYGAKKPYK